MTDAIRIAIVDDHPMVAEGIQSILESYDDVVVIATLAMESTCDGVLEPLLKVTTVTSFTLSDSEKLICRGLPLYLLLVLLSTSCGLCRWPRAR